MQLYNKNIVLTGASSGIGLEVLNLLSIYQNVKIVAVARNIDKIPEKEGVIFPFSADMGTKDGIDSLFEYCDALFENIDLFIANAGYAHLEKLNNPDWAHIEKIFGLNTLSPIYSLEKLTAQKTGKKLFFVCTASAVSIVPLPYYSLYCSTKAAIHQFIKTYRYEAGEMIHTMVVYPVATRTSFFEKAAKAEQPPVPFLTQSPETVARAIIKGIEKNKKQVYPSFLFRLFHFTGRIFPFLFSAYSWNEKRKVEKKLKL